MHDWSDLTEEALEKHFGQTLFGAGRRCYEQGDLLSARRTGNVLRGRCKTDDGTECGVTIRLGRGQVKGGRCACQSGESGVCSHMVAVLIAFAREPETFTDWEDLEEELQEQSVDTLSSVIVRMLKVEPRLEWLLDSALPNRLENGEAVDAAEFREQARSIMLSAGWDYHSMRNAAPNLRPLKEMADAFVELGDYESGIGALIAIMDGILEDYWQRRDDSFHVGNIVRECLDSLGNCLTVENVDSALRGRALDAMVGVYEYGKTYSSDSLTEKVVEVVLEKLPADDQQHVANWLLEYVERQHGEDTKWERESAVRFHLLIAGDGMSDDEYLAFCRKWGLPWEGVDRLLDLGRPEEAIKAAAWGSRMNSVFLAKKLVNHGHDEMAEEMLRKNIEHPNAHQSRDWLKKRYLEREDWAAVLELALIEFHDRPWIDKYKEVEDLSRKLGSWEETRRRLLAKVADTTVRKECKLAIYLYENMIEDAVKLAVASDANSRFSDDLILAAAQAVEDEFPDEALTIYRRKAKSNVHGGGDCDVAADCLARMAQIWLSCPLCGSLMQP